LRVESGLEYLRRKQQLERDIMISSSPSPSHTSSDVLPYHQRPASGSSSSIMKYPSIPPQPSYPARQLVSTVRFRTDHKYYPSRNLGKSYDDSIPSPDCKDIRQVQKDNENDTMDCQNKGDDSVGQEKEDTLWTVFHRLKAVFEPPIERVPSSSLRSVSLMGALEGISPVKQSKPGNGTRSGRNGARGATSARVHHDIIYDDSKRVVDMTEILPNLFIGDGGAAKNTFYLKKIRMTHVLNAAEGSGPGYVDTDPDFYRVFGIKYKGLKLQDAVHTNIAMYFNSAANYIDEALTQDNGKILVNCMMGMSRSSTCVLAYMMLKRNMSALQALKEVRKHREVKPNDGFLRQLADLDNKLRKEREKQKEQ